MAAIRETVRGVLKYVPRKGFLATKTYEKKN
jgi:hypothetical protein